MARRKTPVAPRRESTTAPTPDDKGKKDRKGKSPWILGPAKDMLLFVGTPAVILPAILLAEAFFSTDSLYLFVAAFGALGHHLPGMMRAYGDRSLFRRFRVRFIVAPIALLGFCIWFMVRQPEVLLLTLYAWGVWHALMQTHGFLRIYDSKVGSFARRTAHLDQAMCFTWFLAATIFSPHRVHYVLNFLYKAGVGPFSPELVGGVRLAWAVLTGLVTAAWLANFVAGWVQGQRQSPVKLVLLASSAAFWWYCNVGVANILVGILMFEIFHDVQYLSIVWLFNRRRVDTDPEVGGFTSFVFRQRAVLMVAYVAMVFVYGSLQFLVEGLQESSLGTLFAGIVAASTLLHFYYDGFIWKVREKDTRENLGIKGGGTEAEKSFRLPSWASHGLKWAAFAIPILLLSVAQGRGGMSETERFEALAQICPQKPTVLYNMSTVLLRRGDVEGALEATRQAYHLPPDSEETAPKIRKNYFSLLLWSAMNQVREGRVEAAVPRLREALEADPASMELILNEMTRQSGGGATGTAVGLGSALVQAAPDRPESHLALIESLRRHGDRRQALNQARRAAERFPNQPEISRVLQGLEASTQLR